MEHGVRSSMKAKKKLVQVVRQHSYQRGRRTSCESYTVYHLRDELTTKGK